MYKESVEQGQSAEDTFYRLAKLRGFKVKPATGMEQFDHVDFHLTSQEQDGVMNAMVDVKARKRISRKDVDPQDEWIWVEFKNVRGKDGWLYGLADFIAFERTEDFVLSFRKELVDWCESHVDLKSKVVSPDQAEYLLYTRKGKQDSISMIRMDDIMNLPNTAIWKK